MRERSSASVGPLERDLLRRSRVVAVKRPSKPGPSAHEGFASLDVGAIAAGLLDSDGLLGLQQKAGNRQVSRMAATTVRGSAAAPVVQRWPFGDKDPDKEAAKQKKREENERKKKEKLEAKARHKVNKRAESGERRRLDQERQIGEAKRKELMHDVSGGSDKNDASKMLEIADRFKAKVKEEKVRIEELVSRGIPEDNARDQAYEDVWKGAPPDLRALRPVRETPAEQLQGEIDRFRTDYKTEVSSAKANQRASKRGQLLDTKLEKLYEEQEAMIAELMANGATRTAAEAQALQQVWSKASDKLIAKRPPIGSVFDVQARKEAQDRLAARKLLEPKKRKSVGDKAATGAKKLGEVSEGLESKTGPTAPALDLASEEQLDASKMATSEMMGNLGTTANAANVSSQLGQSSDVFGDIGLFFDSVFGLLGAISDLSNLVADYKSGERSHIDIHTASRVVNNSVTIVNTKANIVSGVVGTISDFTGELASTAAQLVPGLSIATSFASSCGLALELASVSVRLARVNGGLYDARSRGLNPAKVDSLINPLIKLQSVFAQKVEKASFDLGATMIKLAASIAELASAGGYGVPAAIKGAVSLIQAVHGVAHWVAQSVLAWQTQQARSAWVGKSEGGAEQLQRNDASMAVDALIVRARNGDQVAVAFLHTYDLTDDQIKNKKSADLHERLMSDIGAEEDPKTVFQRFADSYRSVAGFFESIDQKDKDVTALRKVRNAADGKSRGEWWEAKMFLKSVFAPGKFERSKHRTEIATGKPLHEKPNGPHVSDPELQGGSFGTIVSIAKDVVLTRESGEDVQTRWSKAVAEMTLPELQAAATAPYHDAEMKAFFANWVEMRLREEAARKRIADSKAKTPPKQKAPAKKGAA
jgi:hypothetical protein